MVKKDRGRPVTAAARPVASGPGTPIDDQALADRDQSAADADQTSSDTDQRSSETDQDSADHDQQASDSDQATADRDRAANHDATPVEEKAYDSSRADREDATVDRIGSQARRQGTARERDAAGTSRDQGAGLRDEGSRSRDAQATDAAAPSSARRAELMRELAAVRAQASADRERAAKDRARAAADRELAARERARLEAALEIAHLDELTGAYRRDVGRLTLSHEIDRARRGDGRFVVAFADVDDLKTVNDREGHAAGDLVLQGVVAAMRARLRSFDPIIRYGGDEFVCGLGGTDLAEATRRFDAISLAVNDDVGVGLSVGLAELAEGDSIDALTQRADAAMFEVKASRGNLH
ncbi:MAG TPA: diguanylate cyclase [Candidatus Limnocylindria bacterium]|nr:diguanylate cyclase [Candidatus Limnocylindria bacterium]